MKIEYTLTHDDYVHYNIYYYQNAPSLRYTRLLWQYVFPLFIALPCAAIFRGAGYPRGMWLAVGCALYALFACAWPWFQRRSIRRIARRMLKNSAQAADVTGRFSLELTATGLREEGNGRATEIAYAGIERIAHDRDRRYIFTGAVTAHIVPQSAYADAAEEARFYEILEARMQAARRPLDETASAQPEDGA